MYVCMHARCLWKSKDHWFPWNWSYRQVWVVIVGAENRTQVPCKSRKYSWPPSRLSTPVSSFLIRVKTQCSFELLHRCAHRYAWVWRPEVNIGHFTQSFSILGFDTVSHWSWSMLSLLHWLFIEPQVSSCLHPPPPLGLQRQATVSGFLHSAGVLNAGVHACAASTLPTKPLTKL